MLKTFRIEVKCIHWNSVKITEMLLFMEDGQFHEKRHHHEIWN